MHHLLPLVKFSEYVSLSLDLSGDFPPCSTHYLLSPFRVLCLSPNPMMIDDSRSEAEHEQSVSENSALKHYGSRKQPPAQQIFREFVSFAQMKAATT